MNGKTDSVDTVCREATLEEILPLRDLMLIQGTNRTSPEFPGDREPDTLHMGVFLSRLNIGCLSLMRYPYEEEPAFQLRGMAVLTDFQGKGYGRSLLDFTEDWVRKTTDIRVLWCNARVSAVGFYSKRDWETISEEFVKV